MAENLNLLLTRPVKAAPAEVCRAFTHATMLRDWLCTAASSDPRPGGHLFLRWWDGATVTGTYEAVDLPRTVRVTWLDPTLPGLTRVIAACEAQPEGTQLTLLHESLEAGPGWEAAQPRLEAFWGEALENLASVVETGIDLRQARRPRLGIIMDELTPKAVARLGIPVKQGVLLHGTAEGTGAQAAGLLKDDVLVRFNGVPLHGPNSFDAALQGLRAGDRPTVEYYRGGVLHSTPLELGSFPIPTLPASPAELAAEVRQLNAKVLSALRAQLDGVGEEQAGRRPAEGEWSVKELVAHFILCERDYQSWVADMLNDVPVEDWLQMRPNVQPRITALVARMNSLPALLDEISLAKEETSAMIESIPESFARDRAHLFRRAAQWEVDAMPGHYFEEHSEQLKVAMTPPASPG